MTPGIAIIDSGINPWHSHVGGVAGAVTFNEGADGVVRVKAGANDHIGHGTAIAGVIRQFVPHAPLYALKIFHTDLNAPMPLLLAALAWAVSQTEAGEIKLIHLSLGTLRQQWRSDLETLCNRAHANGQVVVAAARSRLDLIYPAVLPTVLGVCRDQQCPEDALCYYPGQAVEFGAQGRARSLDGIPDDLNFGGSSFAAARVTGWAARLLADQPCSGAEWLRLQARACCPRGASGTCHVPFKITA